MSVGSILSLGLGAFSDVNHLVTLGYTPGIGLAPVVIPDTTVFAPPRAPVDFVFNSGYIAGFRVPKFRAPNKPAHPRVTKQPQDTDLKEMMGLYAMWRDAA
jgi:hypothetical protein